MSLREQKLGLLISARPEDSGFRHAINLAQAAMDEDAKVYVYCIDEAVLGIGDEQLQSLCERGLILYACAYGAQRRGLPINELAVYAGLGVLGDMIVGTDRFLSFN